MKLRIFISTLLFFAFQTAFGQILISGTATITENFDGMGNSAIATVPTGIKVSNAENYPSVSSVRFTTQTAGTSGAGILTDLSAGGYYNFANGVTASATDRALGFLTLTPFTGRRCILIELKNNTNDYITKFDISFDYEKYRSSTSSVAWLFQHRHMSGAITDVTVVSGNGSRNYTADANNTTVYNPPQIVARTVTISPSNGPIAPNGTYYLAWRYTASGGTSGQAIGIDNLTIKPYLTPSVTTPTATAITTTTATLGANVTADNGSTITSRGTVWGTVAAPTLNSVTTTGTTGVFTTAQTGFTANTVYTYRGFAVNGNGTGYSPDANFTTLHNVPNIGSGSGATATSIVANWTAPTGGGSAAFTYEIQVDDDSAFGSVNFTQNAIASATLSATATGLNPSTTYYYRVRAVNAGGDSAWSATSEGYPTLNANSDVVFNSGSSASTNTNLDYKLYQSATISNTGSGAGGSIGVMGFTIRDGAGSSDADSAGTELTAISFNTTNVANIRSAALFNGSTFIQNVAVNGVSPIVFSGLSGANVTCADNSTLALNLRLTFNAIVTDNQQMAFTVSSVTAAATGSVFATANGGGAVSSSSGDINRIEVIADRLAFVQQPPAQTSVNNAFATASTVSANDVNNNRDLDFVTAISVTSTGTLTGSPVSGTIASGLATFSGLTHTAIGIGLTLTATTTGLSFSNSATSGTFEIVITPNGAYRTTSAGTWPISGTATWERFLSGVWTASSDPVPNTTDLLIIRHTINTNSDFTASGGEGTRIEIDNGGTFTNDEASAFSLIQINSGGKFILESADIDILSSGSIIVESGGTLVIDSGSIALGDSFWEGTENFKAGSIFEIKDWDWNGAGGDRRILDTANIISTNSSGYYFGNIYFNATPSGRAFIFVGKAGTQKLCQNDLTINNGSPSQNTILTDVAANVEIGGSVIVNAGTFCFGAISSGALTHTIKGNLTVNGGTANLNQTSNAAASVFTNLEGNLLVPSSATFTSTDDGCKLRFTNTSVAQTISFAGTLGTLVDFEITSGSTTRIINQNINLGTATNNFNVLGGGIFEFNGFDITGAGTFDLTTTGTLRITSANGVNATGATGNVQTTGTRTFSQTGTYHYVGNATPQSTGTAMANSSTAKRIIIDKTNATDVVNLTQNTGTTNELYIKKGIFAETATSSINGSTGNLVIDNDGIYKIAILTTTVPQLTGTYTLAGNATIELNGAGNQILRGSRAYRNLTFATSGTKTVTVAPTSITGTVTIQDTAIFDAASNTIGGAGTNLTMTGTAQYKTAGTGTKPDAQGTYSLGPGTKIAFTNGLATMQNIRLSPNYYNIDIEGSNVGTSSLATPINMQSGATFKVLNGGIFKFTNTTGFNGSTTTAISNTNSPSITCDAGSTIEYAGDSQTLTPAGYANMTISGTGTKNISTASEILVGDELKITASTLEIDANKLLTVTNAIKNTSGNNIVVKNSGSLVQITNVDNATTNANTGNIKMTRTSRDMQYVYDYVYWGTPVKENVYSQIPASVYDISYQWDLTGNSTGDWNFFSSTTPGRGFISRVKPGGTGAKDFDFTGTPNNGTVSVYADCYSADPNANVTGNTILLSNPYPCAVDATTFVNTNSSILDGTLYFWTSSTIYTGGDYVVADYATWNQSGGTSTAPPTSNPILALKPDGKIASGQGFFVDIKADGNIVFNNLMRLRNSTSNTKFFKTKKQTTSEKHRVWLNLSNNKRAFRQALVGYIDGATNGYDGMFDGLSSTDNEINIYSILDNLPLVIQGKSLPFNENDTIPMGVSITNAGSYTLAIDEVDGLMKNQDIFIEDKLTNLVHNLKTSPYHFNINSGVFNDRFVLRYTDKTLGNSDLEKSSNEVIVSITNQKIKVNSFNQTIDNIKVFDLLGRQLFKKDTLNTNEFTIENFQSNSQVLLIKVILIDGTLVTKKLIF